MENGINNWQRRWHPLLQQWVLIAATSGNRPWSGAMAQATLETELEHDPDCYLCPSVSRANGNKNPDYTGTHSFDNDYPSLSPLAPANTSEQPEFLTTAQANGRCRVLCWSERHDLRLASLPEKALIAAFELCRDEYQLLSSAKDAQYVVIFENKGKEVGMSNSHPHGQAYAVPFVPDTTLRMRSAQHHYFADHGSHLMQDMLEHEHTQSELVVTQNDYWSCLVPFAARFPFETWVVPRRHVNSLLDLTAIELKHLALLYQEQLQRYDILFDRITPNLTMFHSGPCDGDPTSTSSCFHIAMQPPLLTPTRLKYLAGWESSAGNITNPVQPEFAASQLRSALPSD
ncbi:MAG: galactose-1-phosphate uridylyltransferase [Gammaproteobacteria bacterium]|nr:galactose-1-phosphate uridylyltransferase [Gammaproteobacteria bacterium]